MTRMIARTLAVLAAVAALAGPARADQKVVVELFTSQGCSSCPPADAFLTELAKRDDVIALSFHVDYWNYIGWRDPFSSEAATLRQHNYRAGMGLRYVYTPQMVIGGRVEHVGSGRGGVLNKIRSVAGEKMVDVSARPMGKDALEVSIGAGTGGGADIWLVAYDRQHTTRIRRGENSGVTLTNANVVRSLRRVGSWDGKARTLRIALQDEEMKGRSGCAVLVQKPGGGPILGAARLAFSAGGS